MKQDISQKIAPAPIDRKQNSAMGEMALLLVRSLHTMMFTPKIAYAIKHAICPIDFR